MLNNKSSTINYNVGTSRCINGKSVVETEFNRDGHAIYGPYLPLSSGQYYAEFNIYPIDLNDLHDDEVVAIPDISIDGGAASISSEQITAKLLRTGKTRFTLNFTLEKKAVVEYRVWVPGKARLEIESYCPVAAAGSDPEKIRFPKITAHAPAIFQEQKLRLRQLYESGFSIEILQNSLILQRDGIRFWIDQSDDLHLIDEIFVERVYNFESDRPAVVVDVGMNLGLVSLQFAKNSSVKKVYSFEPFPSTYSRALRNIALNPDLSSKIIPANVGIGDIEGPLTINIVDNGDSGAQSTRDSGENGTPIELEMALASSLFNKIADENPECDLIAKIDCEGAEFGIFDVITRAELWSRISAVMVEWHHAIPGKSGEDLIAPLKKAGFLVFDRSPHTLVHNGNGFFYGVRKAPHAAA
ncbi:FkbM family methyltransferase [Sphingomonas crocodyli]|uniref:FkbM family methyltransferase n=1 Tax=Sphingomonas crocodyli TaxID=1979270 RepID=A0A437MBD9_9SPHN|nr:FkbM family methyltransferase [Sphingomonas crocodyli]RVT94936.1 FkbM family methyltransferase [Sphingomonas crocodyli]